MGVVEGGDLSLVGHIDEHISFHPSEEKRSQDLVELRDDSSLLLAINNVVNLREITMHNAVKGRAAT
jgi:hypothetical protein